MSIFKSRVANPASTNAAAKTEERKSSEFWLNVGYSVQTKDAEGNPVTEFISLNKGIPLDDIELLDESRSGKSGAMNQAANKLLSEIREAAAEMEPGETRIIGGDVETLEVQLRRVRDKSQPSITPENNPYLRRAS